MSNIMHETTIAPMLSVRNGIQAIEFYKTAFGAVELYHLQDEAGKVVSKLSIEGAEFWVADESPENFNFSPETLKGGTIRMVMTVNNPDAVFNKAISAGAVQVWSITEDYGWRIGRIVDPFGHHWEIGKPLSENK